MTDRITDLFIEFDEMGFIPTTLCPEPEEYAIEWREQMRKEFDRLTAENAALRARLGKFDNLHIHMGEKVYIIADDNEIIERFICGVHILSTEIIFVTTTQKNYKSCNKKGIAAHIAHGFENSFGLLPLRDFGERAFIHRESALVRLAELKGEKQ